RTLLSPVKYMVITILLTASGFSCAQDPVFSQFYANRLYLNPAYAGEEGCYRLILNYRNQWPALGSDYLTYSASVDKFVEKVQGGLGLHIFRDTEGDGAMITTGINAMYSYTLKVNRKFYIKSGFQVSYFQKRLNWDFIFPDMIDPLYGVIYRSNEPLVQNRIGSTNTDYVDFSAGAIAMNNNYFIGFAVHHLTEPEESFRGNSDAVLPRKYTLHMGTNIPVMARGLKKGDFFVSPNLLFQQQQDFQQINYGFYVTRKSIVAGIMLRQNIKFQFDSFIMLMGYSISNMKFGYSYDLTVSRLCNQTLGAHEISFSYVFNCKPPGPKYHVVKCPL
ncbi:MAG: PorP/SprF family type IX secretion system membrane protein, partial [Bacteroidota bacterium]